MPELIVPDARVHRSFLAAIAEFQAEGRGLPSDNTMLGEEMRQWSATWSDPEVFASWVKLQHEARLEEAPRPAGFVPVTNLWWVEGDEFLGRIAIRHRLTPMLREFGGHIGYDIRAGARRRGHATAMLRTALPLAHDLGIDPALLTCDVDNIASRRVIERNGGRLEDQRDRKLRFWVQTGS
jgi:predicted acetyltransferase